MAQFRALSSLLAAAVATQVTAEPIAVFGHKVPDTDTITSAIIYAWELGERNITARPFRLGEINKETEFVLEKFGVPLPELLTGLDEKRTVAIVDTNNPKELPDDLSKAAAIHSIVDHHKLSGLANSVPLEVDMRSLCSATSILYARAKAFGLAPPRGIAGLMLAGIVSDSLGFRSPTTTETDRQHAAELEKLLGDITVEELTTKMLDAKANTDHLSPKELVMMDTKVFKMSGKNVRVSVIETTKADGPMARQGELVKAMQKLATEEKLDDVLLFVVDILKEHAVFVSSSDTAAKLVEVAWGVTVSKDKGTVVLPGVLSRKKQIVPKLEEASKKLSAGSKEDL